MTEQQQEQQEEVTETTTTTTTTYTTDEYEYRRKRFRKSYRTLDDSRKDFIEKLDEMLDVIFAQCPEWSVRRALNRIINDNPDLHIKYGSLYHYAGDGKYESRIQKNRVSSGHDNSATIFSENIQETTEREEKEHAVMEAEGQDLAKGQNENGEQMEMLDNRYPILQAKYTKLYQEWQDRGHRIESLEKEVRDLIREKNQTRGRIRLSHNLIQDYLRDNSCPDEYFIDYEAGSATGVSAA